MLRGSCRGTRLVVDLDAKSVTLDGKTIWPSDVWLQVLHELVKARGIPISRSHMRKNSDLELEDRIDRQIKEIRAKLKIDIQSSKRGFYLPEEYWGGVCSPSPT
jgi:DNA-binding response OmpR family regulator